MSDSSLFQEILDDIVDLFDQHGLLLTGHELLNSVLELVQLRFGPYECDTDYDSESNYDSDESNYSDC